MMYNLHNQYLLAIGKSRVEKKKHAIKLLKEYNVSNGKVKKLIPNLDRKKEFDLHLRNFQLYLQLKKKIL